MKNKLIWTKTTKTSINMRQRTWQWHRAYSILERKCTSYSNTGDIIIVFWKKIVDLQRLCIGGSCSNFSDLTFIGFWNQTLQLPMKCSPFSSLHHRPIIKQLINQFDFEALSIKMDRCKELFFLLSEQDPSVPDGTVLAESLALELAAGGLTYENTNFVSCPLC